MKILIDMNLTPLWVREFESCGWTVIHWSKIGKASSPDNEIMEWASRNGYCIFTHDLDFGFLLATMRLHRPSVIQIRGEDVMPESAARWILPTIKNFCNELEAGAIITIDPHRRRLRLLPIRPAEHDPDLH